MFISMIGFQSTWLIVVCIASFTFLDGNLPSSSLAVAAKRGQGFTDLGLWIRARNYGSGLWGTKLEGIKKNAS